MDALRPSSSVQRRLARPFRQYSNNLHDLPVIMAQKLGSALATGAALLAVGIVLYLSSGRPRSSDHHAPTPDGVDNKASEPPGLDTPTVQVQRSSAIPASTEVPIASTYEETVPSSLPPIAGDFLKDFYGNDWDRVRPLVSKRIPLEARLDIIFPPWEVIRDQVCEQMRVTDAKLERLKRSYILPAPLTADVLSRMFPGTVISEFDLLALDNELAEVRQLVDACFQDYKRAVDSVLVLKCAQGNFDYAPCTIVDRKHASAQQIFADDCIISGWVIAFDVAEVDSQELPEIMQRLRNLQSQARRIISRFLAEEPR